MEICINFPESRQAWQFCSILISFVVNYVQLISEYFWCDLWPGTRGDRHPPGGAAPHKVLKLDYRLMLMALFLFGDLMSLRLLLLWWKRTTTLVDVYLFLLVLVDVGRADLYVLLCVFGWMISEFNHLIERIIECLLFKCVNWKSVNNKKTKWSTGSKMLQPK